MSALADLANFQTETFQTEIFQPHPPPEHPVRLVLLTVLVGVAALLVIFMALDCLLRSFKHHGRITGYPQWDKMIWLLICLTVVGAVVYYFVVRRKAPHISQ